MQRRHKEALKKILDNPYLLGHLVGKDKLTILHSYWIKFCFYPVDYFLAEDKKQLKLMLNFFNGMGKTLEIIVDNQKIDKENLTEESLLKLLYNDRRTLKGHRGSYKTTAIVIIGSIIRLLFEPCVRIAIVRKDFTKSSQVLKTIASLMKKSYIRELFKLAHKQIPRATKSTDAILVYNFKLDVTPEGNVNAHGVHQDLTGKHYDIIICDDFVSLQDRISKAEREKTKVHIEEIANNILDPGKQIIFLGTVWHKDDAWTICPHGLSFAWQLTGIMDEKTIKEKKESMTRVAFSANYELTHIVSEDAMFSDPHYAQWEFSYKTGIYGHLDAKYSGKDTNGLTFMCKKKNGRFQAIGFCFHEHIDDKLDFVYEKWKKYFCGTLFNEKNADKGYLAKDLRKKGISVQTYNEQMNKHIKIETFLYKNWNLIDWDFNTDPEYICQILDYIEGEEPDDCPDSAASLLRQKFADNIVCMDRWKW